MYLIKYKYLKIESNALTIDSHAINNGSGDNIKSQKMPIKDKKFSNINWLISIKLAITTKKQNLKIRIIILYKFKFFLETRKSIFKSKTEICFFDFNKYFAKQTNFF